MNEIAGILLLLLFAWHSLSLNLVCILQLLITDGRYAKRTNFAAISLFQINDSMSDDFPDAQQRKYTPW